MYDLDPVIAAYWHADTAAAHAWFTLLCQAQADAAAAGDAGNHGADLTAWWATVESASAAMGQIAPAAAIDALTEVLARVSNPQEFLAEAARYSPDQLTARYEVLLTQAYAAQATEDPDTWNAYLSANGPAWDGTEQNWTVFRDWFARYAAQAGVGNAAATFLSYVEGSADKVTAFAQYGLTVPTTTPTLESPNRATGVPAAEDMDGFAEGDLAALFADPEIDDIAADLAKLDDAGIAALAAEVAVELGEHQDH